MMKKIMLRAYVIIVIFVIGGDGLFAQDANEAWVDSIRAPQYLAIYVIDVDSSVSWYRTVFGLQKLGGSKADDGSWRIENLGNDQLFVEIIRDNRAKVVDRALGFRKVGFFVRDVEEVAVRMARSTGEWPRVVDFEQFGQRVLQLRDPDGNIIQLISPISKYH